MYWLLERACASVRQRIERLAVAHLGVTAAQLPVLFYLAKRSEARPSELAEALHANAAAITGLTARMEAAGLLLRRPTPDDGRGQALSLTAAGRRVAERALPAVASVQAELLAGFGEHEVEIVLRFLHTVAERAPELGAALFARPRAPRKAAVRAASALHRRGSPRSRHE